jgi:hypothetical protein
MIPLAATPDNMDFDGLVALGRSRLPALAPGWTDYNVHDPGITLIELLAWVADTQIYAAGRNRADERLAMAALIGLRPRGAVPAIGVLYAEGDTGQADHDIAAGTRLTPAAGCAPRLEVLRDVSLLPLKLLQLTAEGGAAGTVDFTDANKRARVSFAPFGIPPVRDSALVARLGGRLPCRDLLLSIGIEIEGGGSAGPEDNCLGAVSLFYRRAKGDEVPLDCVLDTSVDMQCNGVMIVRLPAGGPQAGCDTHDIVLRPDTANALMPRLLRVAPNALPVAQKASFPQLQFHGTGRANQKLFVEPNALFEADERVEGRQWRLTDARAEVRVGTELWTAGTFQSAGPADPFFAVSEAKDGSGIEIAFGNGVNGRRPRPYEPIEVALELSCGAAGNVASPLDWLMAAPRIRWRNRQPIAGGADAEGPAELLDAARRRLRDRRPLTASREIEDAALGLPDPFGVTRASVIEGWERGRRRPGAAATRTLLVTRRGKAAESPAWLRAIARALRPRIPLGERLLVAAPAFREMRVAARITAAVGARPERVHRAVCDDLARRLAGGTWPLGRSVSATAVAGWIRRVAGVERVSDVKLLGTDEKTLGEVLELRADELPRLATDRVATSIVVEAGAGS